MTKLALGVGFVENTKLAETVSICVNPRLISSCLRAFVAEYLCALGVLGG